MAKKKTEEETTLNNSEEIVEPKEKKATKKKTEEETPVEDLEKVVESKEKPVKETKKKTVKKTTKSKDDTPIEGSENTLIPLNDYIRSGTYIGTKVITPHMRPYIYRRRNDGIAIINTNIIDEKLKEAAKYLADYNPDNVIIVCKREAGWRAVKLFSELTGIRVFTKKYPAGIITNTALPDFFETELVVICDPWIDKNALKDANMMKKKVLALCDTNNFTFGADKVIPCNNKSNKSLGVVFYILAREYLNVHRMDKKLPAMEEFIGEKLEDFIKEKKDDKLKEEELKKEQSKVEKLLKLSAEPQ